MSPPRGGSPSSTSTSISQGPPRGTSPPRRSSCTPPAALRQPRRAFARMRRALVAANSNVEVGHNGCVLSEGMASMPAPSPPPPLESSLGYHGAVSAFKRRLIEATLRQVSGNRTHAARVLGLQRTYLLRLIRELGVAAPPPPARRRSPAYPPRPPPD